MPSRRDILRSTIGGFTLAGVGSAAAEPAGGNGGPPDEPPGGSGERGPPAGHPYPDEDDPRYFVGVTSKDAMNMVRGMAREVQFVYDFRPHGWTVLGKFREETRRALENRPRVRYVEVDRYVEPHATLDCEGKDPSKEECTPWGIDRIDADVTASGDSPFDSDGNNETGSGADVAIIDTGIDVVHDDLKGNLGGGTATFTGWEGTLECHCDSSLSADGNCNENWDDDGGHGSHVAGTVGAVAGNGIGVEGAGPDITLHAAKVLHGDYCSCCSPVCTGCDSGCTQDCNSNGIVAAAIKWAADQGYDVANLSLGGGGAATAIRDALAYAYYGHSANQGASGSNTTLAVSSAGNPGGCDNPYGDVSYPAKFNQAIAVSATRYDDTLALYSATGEAVELAAPGGTAWDNKDTCEQDDSTLVFSSEPRNSYAYKAGTSMAAPHVSGAAALLINQGMDPFMAREQLAESAEDLGLSADQQGHGLVDPANALELDSSDDGSNSLPLTVVRGQQTKVDSTTARLFGWWSGDAYTDSNIDNVGFQWREYDQSSDQWGSWNSISTTSIPADPPKFSLDITIKEPSKGCFAYQYYAFVNASDGTSDTSRRRAFWNDRSC